MGNRDPIRSEKIRQYKEATGCSLRTAQRHANQDGTERRSDGSLIPVHKNHEDWLKFSGEKKSEILPNDQATSMMPPPSAPVVDGSEEGQMLAEMWNLWTTTKSDRDEAKDDPAVRVVLGKALIDIQKAYRKAKVDFEAARRDREQIVTVADYAAVHIQVIAPIAAKIREMPSQLARDDDDLGRMKKWVTEQFDPLVRSCFEALGGDSVAA